MIIKLHRYIVALLIVVLSITFAAKYYTHSKALSFIEAYKVASNKALNWNKEALLYYATSTDKNNDLDKLLNGERYYWNFEFAVPNTNKHYILELSKGDIEKELTLAGRIFDKKNLISKEQIVVDSTIIVRDAINKFNLLPGEDWANGYHFSISILDNTPTMCVLGLDNQKNLSKISYDIETGNMIRAAHKVLTSGGLYFNNNLINIFPNEVWGCMGTEFNPQNYENFIAWGYRNINNLSSHPFIKETTDGGKTWNEIDLKEDVSNVWYKSDLINKNSLYVITENKVYKQDEKNNWSSLLKTDLAIINSDNYKNIITILTLNKLYISKDSGETWTSIKVPENCSGVFINKSKHILIISNNNTYLLNQDSIWVKNDSCLKLSEFEFYNNERATISFSENVTLNTLPAVDIMQIHVNPTKDQKEIYALLDSNCIQKFVKDGDSNVFELRDTIYHKGQVQSVGTNTKNEVVFSVMPAGLWEEMKGC